MSAPMALPVELAPLGERHLPGITYCEGQCDFARLFHCLLINVDIMCGPWSGSEAYDQGRNELQCRMHAALWLAASCCSCRRAATPTWIRVRHGCEGKTLQCRCNCVLAQILGRLHCQGGPGGYRAVTVSRVRRATRLARGCIWDESHRDRNPAPGVLTALQYHVQFCSEKMLNKGRKSSSNEVFNVSPASP